MNLIAEKEEVQLNKPMMVNKFSIEGYQKALELLHSCINNYGFQGAMKNL